MVMQTPFLLKKYYSGKILWIQIISTGIVGIKFDKYEGAKKLELYYLEKYLIEQKDIMCLQNLLINRLLCYNMA